MLATQAAVAINNAKNHEQIEALNLELVEHSMVMIKEKAMKHGISCDLQISREVENLEIMADERRLKQIMFNLLSNAVKFTPDGGSIRISLDLTIGQKPAAPGKFVLISVEDSGLGIAPDDQDKIFDEYYQISGGSDGKTTGTGLGLTVTRRMVEMHGGRIWVESGGLGKGSRFSFILPLRPEYPAKGKPETDIEPSTIDIKPERDILRHLRRAINTFKRHNIPFTLCRFHVDISHLEAAAKDIFEALENESRDIDLLGTDEDSYICLILFETRKEDAKAAYIRIQKTLENLLNGRKVSCSTATCPKDGESPEELLKIVRNDAL